MTYRDDGWNDHLKPPVEQYHEWNPPPLPEPDSERVDGPVDWNSEPEVATIAARVAGAAPADVRSIAGPTVPEHWPKPQPFADARLSSVTLTDFLGTDFPPRDLLLAPWLPMKGLAMIYAARGVGKTHVALAVAYAVATGGSALGWRAPTPRKVLLIDGEMPAVALQERLAGIIKAAGVEPPTSDHVRLLAADICEFGIPDLSTEGGQAALAPLLEGSDLIVVDNLSTVCRSGRENESESWGAVQAWALAQRRVGRTVLFVHHAGKGGAQRGTSKREDVLDTVIRLDRPEDYAPTDGARFNITFDKARGFYGADAEGFEARFDDGRWTTRPIADALAERVYALADEGLSQRDIATEVCKSAATVNRLIKRRGIDT